jgi:hypothetical protein
MARTSWTIATISTRARWRRSNVRRAASRASDSRARTGRTSACRPGISVASGRSVISTPSSPSQPPPAWSLSPRPRSSPPAMADAILTGACPSGPRAGERSGSRVPATRGRWAGRTWWRRPPVARAPSTRNGSRAPGRSRESSADGAPTPPPRRRPPGLSPTASADTNRGSYLAGSRPPRTGMMGRPGRPGCERGRWVGPRAPGAATHPDAGGRGTVRSGRPGSLGALSSGARRSPIGAIP